MSRSYIRYTRSICFAKSCRAHGYQEAPAPQTSAGPAVFLESEINERLNEVRAAAAGTAGQQQKNRVADTFDACVRGQIINESGGQTSTDADVFEGLGWLDSHRTGTTLVYFASCPGVESDIHKQRRPRGHRKKRTPQHGLLKGCRRKWISRISHTPAANRRNTPSSVRSEVTTLVKRGFLHAYFSGHTYGPGQTERPRGVQAVATIIKAKGRDIQPGKKPHMCAELKTRPSWSSMSPEEPSSKVHHFVSNAKSGHPGISMANKCLGCLRCSRGAAEST